MKLHEVVKIIFYTSNKKSAGKAEFKDNKEAEEFLKKFDKKNFVYRIVKEFPKKNIIKKEEKKPSKEEIEEIKRILKRTKEKFK